MKRTNTANARKVPRVASSVIGRPVSGVGLSTIQIKSEVEAGPTFDGTAMVVIPQNGRKIKFTQLDPVLSLEGPHALFEKNGKKPESVKKCQVCETDNVKGWAQCEFCANWGCKTCVYKQYPFPIQQIDFT